MFICTDLWTQFSECLRTTPRAILTPTERPFGSSSPRFANCGTTANALGIESVQWVDAGSVFKIGVAFFFSDVQTNGSYFQKKKKKQAHFITRFFSTWTRLPVASRVRPGGQTQVNDPSVLTQVPPPLQIPGLRSHSLMSRHILPTDWTGHLHSVRHTDSVVRIESDILYHVSFVAIAAAVFLLAWLARTAPGQSDRATAIRFQGELGEIVFTPAAGQTGPTRTATVICGDGAVSTISNCKFRKIIE